MIINAKKLHFRELNKIIKSTEDFDVTIENCLGHRYIGSGLSNHNITIKGVPGNALGAYLDGSKITVEGNAQDATGDTMNEGSIYIHGLSGDATGYAMRGGKIFVKGNAGYRAGIHMKAYKEKVPVIVIGGCAGNFLGEYQAGGIIVVLGLDSDGAAPVGNFCGTGMHGGRIFLRCRSLPHDLPKQVVASKASPEDMEQVKDYIEEYCNEFGENKEKLLSENFFVLSPDTKNPYKQLYTHN